MNKKIEPSTFDDRKRQAPDAPHSQPAADPDRLNSASESPTLSFAAPVQSTSPSAPGSTTPLTQLPATFGRYEIIRLLGKGGMGTVYLARDTQLDRQVALKIPQLGGDDDSSVTDRFMREARSAATLHHANICPVHDVGQIDGTLYLTMAHIEGRTLAEWIRSSSKPLTCRQTATLVRKLALALDEAHRKQVIHRDLKPANIMLTKRGEPVIMDFGLARRRGAIDSPLTQFGSVMGTPAYMAPEQARGNPDEIGPACDIYSLGVMLYELLAGRLPFTGDAMKVLTQVLTEEPEPPSRYRADLDPELEMICLQAMAKRPKNRYGSMSELAGALGEYIRGATQSKVATGAEIVLPAPEVPLEEILRQLDTSISPPIHQGTDLRRDRHIAHPQPKRRSQNKNRKLSPMIWIAGAAGVAALILASIIITVQTQHGSIQIELSDSSAGIEVRIDGDTIDITGLDQPIRLKPGEHNILVQGGDFETYSESFTVKRGGNPVMHVKLLPKQSATGFEPELADKSSEKRTQGTIETSQERDPAIAAQSIDGKATPPVVATKNPAPSAKGANASLPPVSNAIPKDRWITLDEDTADSTNWKWTNNKRKTHQMDWEDGILRMENHAIAFNSIQARNVSFRAQVKFIEGNNMALIVRGIHGGKAGVYALFDRLDDGSGRMFIALLDTESSKVIPAKNDFFEFRVNAIDDLITVQVNGETVLEHRETRSLNAGHVSLTAYDSSGVFKDIEVKILDD
jgi:serine/threonine protein kinase